MEDKAVICTLNTDYSNTGVWNNTVGGLRYWRTAVRVRDATSISLVFSKFRLEKGVRLFVYDVQQKEILGAFTSKNNKESGLFAVSAVHADRLIVELQVMSFVEDPGELELGWVAIDYNMAKSTKAVQDTFFRMSGECNVDINCDMDSIVQVVKHSVVRIVYDGTERCTGTLMNNTRNNGYPFLLTAGHCIDNQLRANTALFYFNYESPVCNGPDGSTALSISGANLLATTNHQLDFSLLELSEPIPFFYRPYYAGWDHRNDPPASSYTIHHPQGDVKKISTDDDRAESASFGEGYDPDTHWRILHWETGTTEKGSSGCGLFNQDSRLTGTLTGGSAMCGYSFDDFFQKLYDSWADYPLAENQLKYWLDPLLSEIQYLDGYDPYADFWITGDTLTNIPYEDTAEVYSNNLEWGYLSGQNADSIRFYAEKFEVSASHELLGIIINTGPVFAVTDTSKIKVFIRKNLTGDENIILIKEILLADLIADDKNLIDLDTSISVTGDFYIGYEVFYNTSEDTFSVKINLTDDPESSNTAFFMKKYGEWAFLSTYYDAGVNISLDISPIIFDSIPKSPHPLPIPPENDVFVYPVPARDMVHIKFWELPRFDVEISLYNISGQLIKSELYQSPDIIINYNLDNISSGIYIIKMNVNNFIITKKISVL